MAARARSRGPFDYWPGFVDVLSTLLLVITFMLSIFMLGQYFLGQQLNSRDQAIASLEARVAELANLLSVAEKSSEEKTAELAKLRATLADAEDRAAAGAAPNIRLALASRSRFMALAPLQEDGRSRDGDRARHPFRAGI